MVIKNSFLSVIQNTEKNKLSLDYLEVIIGYCCLNPNTKRKVFMSYFEETKEKHFDESPLKCFK